MVVLITQARQRVSPWLIRELRKRIPSFNPYTLDFKLAVFAQRDLETCLSIMWGEENNHKIRVKLRTYLSRQPEETKVFLGFWVDRWLEKWRERVRILYKKFNIPPGPKVRSHKAKKIYKSRALNSI